MIKLKIVEADDTLKLTTLKSRYNRLAIQLNRSARLEPEKDTKKLSEGLKALEDQINSLHN